MTMWGEFMGESTNEIASLDPLTGSLREYRDPHGQDLFKRVEDFYTWQNLRRRYGYWPYSKSTDEAPQAVCAAKDDAGRGFRGVNFASQDYLSLASHPAIKEAAKDAITDYGVHSAGSAAFLGNTKYSLALQKCISEFLQLEHTVLYPTGWAAGYGVIRGLIRPDDHIVIDGLAHNCLQDGALAATRNVYLHGHLNLQSTRRHLKRIRARDQENGILVVTEGLFSMDSDTPDIGAMQDLCREFNATLMVDSCNSPAVKEYLRYFGSSGTFSNALSPIQSAIVLKAFEIVRSEEGRTLRADLMKNVLYLRDQLKAAGLEVVGDPSAIVSVKVGDEGLARLVSQRLPRLGAIANLVEFPAVAKGSARFRLQVMAKHSKDNIDRLLAALLGAIEAAQQSPRYYRTLMPTEETTTAFPSSQIPVRARAVGE